MIEQRTPSTRSRTFRVACVALCFAIAWTPASAQRAPDEPSVRVIQVNVGQGDAAIAISPLGRRALIDAGPSGVSLERALKSLRIDTIQLVVASHNHSDHIGGMPAVLTHHPVRAYVDNGIPTTTATYRNTLAALRRNGAQYLSATARTITLDSLRVQILPPADSADQNNGSVGALLEFGEFRALYTGDSQEAALETWLEQGLIPRVSLLKVAHHGSRNGTTAQLIAATQPRVVVISVGKNGYGHPNKRVIAAWRGCGARVYRTDIHGTVEITATRDARLIVRTGSGLVDTLPPPVAVSPR